MPQADLLPAFDALVAIGAKYGDRSARAKAKIKLLVETRGYAGFVDVFDAELAAAKRGAPLPALTFARSTSPAPDGKEPPPRAGDVIAQKQPDRFTVPALIPMGELAADAAERFGDGIVHLTPDQNAELQSVAGADVNAARSALAAFGLHTRGRGGIADVVSCVGLEYCPLAVAHSMTLGAELALAFDELRTAPRYADFRIHVSGCPHSCAKHQVADIGLAGGQTEYKGERVEAYTLYLGGNARERRLGATAPKKIPRALVVPVIRALLACYEGLACDGERFSATVARTGDAPFFAAVDTALSDPSATGTAGHEECFAPANA